MTYEEYRSKREEMIASAQACIEKGDAEGSKRIRLEVEAMDNNFAEIKKENANIRALGGGVQKMPKSKAPVVKAITENVDRIDEGKPEAANAQDELYRTAFAKTLMGARLNEEERTCLIKTNGFDASAATHGDPMAASTTMTATDNAIIIPNTMLQSIWQEMGETHPIIAQVPFTDVKGTVEIPKENTDIGDAEFVDEDTPATDSKATFGSIILNGCELVKAVSVSWKMKEMSIDAFMTYITSKLAEKMANAIANAIVNGKGTPGATDTFKDQPYGIITRLKAEASTPQVVQYTTSVGYTDITSALSKIKSGYVSACKIYAKNTDIWNMLANILDGQKRPIFIPDPTGQTIGRLFGREVVEEDAIPEGKFLIGDVRRGYVMNRNKNVALYSEDHVKDRKTDYMGYAVIDGDVLTTKAFALLELKTA